MATTIMVLGGYGEFGSRIARGLSREPGLRLLIAGRHVEKGARLVSALGAGAAAEAVEADVTRDLRGVLRRCQPHLVVHACGPFQGQGYAVAEACIAQGVHYLDLADGRDFVTGIVALGERARKANVLVVSGASTVPGLTSAIVDRYSQEFSLLRRIEAGVTAGQRARPGLATLQGILSYVGKPFRLWWDGRWQTAHGWQGLRRARFPALGRRWMALCDVPDLALFPERYPGLQSVRFYAGLEVGLAHLGLWGLSWLVRGGLIGSLREYAPLLQRASAWFDLLGSGDGALFLHMEGEDAAGHPRSRLFHLVATKGDGPYVPCAPAIVLARKVARGELRQRGAMPCLGLVTLEECLAALTPYHVRVHA
jgi:hypothetical protein